MVRIIVSYPFYRAEDAIKSLQWHVAQIGKFDQVQGRLIQEIKTWTILTSSDRPYQTRFDLILDLEMKPWHECTPEEQKNRVVYE